MNDFLSLKQLGELYGVSSHKVGKWLKGLGLRTTSGGPSAQAFEEGYVQRSRSTQPGTYFYVWHRVRTTAILDGMRYVIRSNGSLGLEILDGNGKTIAWTTNMVVAQVIVELMAGVAITKD